MKKVLVSGAKGFIGKNLVLALSRVSGVETNGVDTDSTTTEWDRALESCDIVFHLAGINRPETEKEFEEGNVGSLATVINGLERCGQKPLIVLSSSTQALLDNPYGRSKMRAENALLEYSKRASTSIRIFRLPGVFGKWCRPNYNSVVATFCYNIARDIPISISDPEKEIEIVHVDDVIAVFLSLLKTEIGVQSGTLLSVEPVFKITLGNLVEKLRRFRAVRETLSQPNLADPFDRRLFGTFISYLPQDQFDYDLTPKEDERGVLAELLKLDGHGQIFVSRTHPGITRGNHYHDLKVEKFVVLEGQAIIRFRHMVTSEVVEYPIEGREMRVVDIPPGWTHSIENVGNSEMIVLFWASEVFNSALPDTFYSKVRNEEA